MSVHRPSSFSTVGSSNNRINIAGAPSNLREDLTDTYEAVEETTVEKPEPKPVKIRFVRVRTCRVGHTLSVALHHTSLHHTQYLLLHRALEELLVYDCVRHQVLVSKWDG